MNPPPLRDLELGRNPRTGENRADTIVARLLAEDVEPRGANWRADATRLWRQYLRPYRMRFVTTGVITLIWSFMPYSFALSWRFLIDHVLQPATAPAAPNAPAAGLGMRGVLIFFAINATIWTLHLIFERSRNWIVHSTSLQLILALRRDLHNKLADLHIAYFDRTPVGRLMSRVMDDVNVIQGAAMGLLVALLGSSIKLIYGPALLLYLDWRLALPAIAVLPLFGIVMYSLRKRIKETNRGLRRLNSRTYARAAERVGGVRLVQAFTREQAEVRRLTGLLHAFVRIAMRLVNYEQRLSLIQHAITATTAAIIIYFGARAVQLERMTLGDFVAFISCLNSIYGPIHELLNQMLQAQATQVVVRRVFSLLDEPVEVASGKISLDGMQGKVEFDRVSFRYPGQKRPALTDLSFVVRPGERIALMGPSGSGKSTVFQLLLRFYDPQQGAVRVGGVDLVEVNLDSLRRHVCMVQQEPVIFSGTIAENITYGRANAQPIEVARAAKAADLHDYVTSLPFVYHTEVGEGGLTLSGGQRQRLALATALLTQPEVLLLDDTTSALDAATEARIRDTLHQVLQNRTSLVITQRIVTARDCDRILVLSRGRIAQSGTHAELRAQDGFYRAVCEQQGQE